MFQYLSFDRRQPLTTDYRLRTNLKSFRATIRMGDRRAKNHAATSRLLFTSSLKYTGLLRKSVLHVDVAFLQYTDAVAGDHHVLRRIHVYLDHDGTVDFTLDTRGRVLAADATCLIEHVGRDTAEVRADEDLKRGRFIVTDQTHDRKTVSGTILHRSSGALGLVTSPVLLLRLADYLQLHLSIRGCAACES